MNKNIKRIGILALVIVLCLGMATSALAACTANVDAGSLNIRAGVGTGYRVLKAVPRDTSLYYLGVSEVDNQGDLWYKVQYGAYNTGWVFADYCSLTNYTTTSYCTANSGDTYIRSNPNLDGSRLGVLKQGQTAYYLGQVMTDYRGVDWYYVNYNGTYGWVSTMYTYLHTENSFGFGMIPTLPTYGATKGTVKAEGGDAYIRSTGSLNGYEIAVLKKGYSATYLNERSVDDRGVVWFKVSYNGNTGWISSRYAMLYGNIPASSSSSSSASTKNYVKATGECNVRQYPSLNGKALTIMKKGETASYLKETSVDERGVVWYKIKFEGLTGWVSSKYASLTNSASGSSAPSYSYVVSNAKTNLRDDPSLYGEVLDVMYKGDRATYTGTSTYDGRGVLWYKVKFDGQTGWVSSKYTELD